MYSQTGGLNLPRLSSWVLSGLRERLEQDYLPGAYPRRIQGTVATEPPGASIFAGADPRSVQQTVTWEKLEQDFLPVPTPDAPSYPWFGRTPSPR